MKIDEAIEYELNGGIPPTKNIYSYRNQIVEWLEELKQWRTSVVNENIKNDFANRSTLICHNCDHKDEYIEELEYELEKYRTLEG